MYKSVRVLAVCAAWLAAAPAFAQQARPRRRLRPPQPSPPRPRRRPRPRDCPACRRPSAARHSPSRRRCRPAGSGPVICGNGSLLRSAGQPDAGRVRHLPLLHPVEGQPALAGHVGAVRRAGREDHSRGLSPALEHQLPRQPVGQQARVHLLERRGRRDGHLRHGGAAARQDRRLQGLASRSKSPRSTRSSKS